MADKAMVEELHSFYEYRLVFLQHSFCLIKFQLRVAYMTIHLRNVTPPPPDSSQITFLVSWDTGSLHTHVEGSCLHRLCCCTEQKLIIASL
jgi:hypothetical protein